MLFANFIYTESHEYDVMCPLVFYGATQTGCEGTLAPPAAMGCNIIVVSRRYTDRLRPQGGALLQPCGRKDLIRSR